MTGMSYWIALTALAVVLIVAYDPLVAGYVFAGGAVAFILGLLGTGLARRIENWRLGRGWTRHKPTGSRPTTGSEESEHRHAA